MNETCEGLPGYSKETTGKKQVNKGGGVHFMKSWESATRTGDYHVKNVRSNGLDDEATSSSFSLGPCFVLVATILSSWEPLSLTLLLDQELRVCSGAFSLGCVCLGM